MIAFICTKFPIREIYNGTRGDYQLEGPLWTKVNESICMTRKHAAFRRKKTREIWEKYLLDNPFESSITGTVDDFLHRFGYSVSDYLVMQTESLGVCEKCGRVKI